jgi:hypothetical protein
MLNLGAPQPLPEEPMTIRIDYKASAAQHKRKFKRLPLKDRLDLSIELQKMFINGFNTDLTFDYKRFIADPNFSSYYYVRCYEPSKLELLISMGLKYNIYLQHIYYNEGELEGYPFKPIDNVDDQAYKLVGRFANYLKYLDKLLLKDKGPIALFHKDNSSTFFVPHSDGL